MQGASPKIGDSGKTIIYDETGGMHSRRSRRHRKPRRKFSWLQSIEISRNGKAIG
jgi:hypothetical protein